MLKIIRNNLFNWSKANKMSVKIREVYKMILQLHKVSKILKVETEVDFEKLFENLRTFETNFKKKSLFVLRILKQNPNLKLGKLG